MKKIILVIIALSIAAAISGYLLYNKPHRNTADESAIRTMEANLLYNEFDLDEHKANAAFLDKLLQVKGVIASIDKSEGKPATVVLQTNDPMGGISCELLPESLDQLAKYTEGSTINIKGICTGKLMDVVLVRCVIVE